MSCKWTDTLSAALDDALQADLSGLAPAEVVQLAREAERLRCRLAGVAVRIDAELESRSIAGEFARSSTVDLLVSELRLTPGEAKERVGRAQDLGPRRTLGGQPLPALLPTAAAALEDGAISPGHITVITRCSEELPTSASFETLTIVESTLVDAARAEHPGQLRRTAALLLARLDPDGDEPREDEAERRRCLTLTRHADGTGRLAGRLTVEATAFWDAILDSLSVPVPSEDGERDDRSAAQRRHDAFAEAGQRLLRSDTLPAAGGVPVTVLVRTTLSELREGHGVALTTRGDLWPVASLMKQGLSDAQLVPVLSDRRGAVLDLGRTRRLASPAQRLALAARDGGCSFPGCDRPPGWTQAHHVRDWVSGGATDIDNLTLLCRFHHREFVRRGWAVRMNRGMPEWVPPSWFDPAQAPRRNRTHHLDEHRFDRALQSLTTGSAGARAA